MEAERCSSCGGYHGKWPLAHLKVGEDCGFDRTAPCDCCGEAVGALSFGGPSICPACDCGVHRDTGKKWTQLEAFLIFRDRITPGEARRLLAPI
jgi:hypothetical protein